MEKSGKAEGQGLEYLRAVRMVCSGQNQSRPLLEESVKATFVFQAPLKGLIPQREHLLGHTHGSRDHGLTRGDRGIATKTAHRRGEWDPHSQKRIRFPEEREAAAEQTEGEGARDALGARAPRAAHAREPAESPRASQEEKDPRHCRSCRCSRSFQSHAAVHEARARAVS